MFVYSNIFMYIYIIYMYIYFCSKTANNLINKIHKCSLCMKRSFHMKWKMQISKIF